MTHDTEIHDVLVVGAGPAGLSTAISALRHGARVLVVERHPTTSVHPRATAVSTRTMEIFRTWGVADAVRAGGVDVSIGAAVGRTLSDPELTAVPSGYPAPREALAVSPALPACSPQDHIEPLLVEQVRRHGGRVRLGTELTELRTGPGGVRAVLTDRASGARRSVRARYVVGADGSRSTVRAALGIGVQRLGTMGEFVQVLFRAAELEGVLGSRRHALYIVQHPEADGLVLPAGPGRWAYARQYFPERGESAADLTAARWTELVRLATGVPDLRPEILGDTSFTLAAEMATAFRAGPGFLAGDAAHRTTPVAGVGMNTAVHDGHNLGWKLAWAARGLAGEDLLASYAEERYPVGLRNTVRSLRGGEPDPSDGLAGDLGSHYCSAVIAAADEPPAGGFAVPDLDGAEPGERAPHVWVHHGGRRRSTLDLFDGRLTLLIGRNGRGWQRAAAHLARAGVPVAGLTAGVDLAEGDDRLARTYRIGGTGAVLVRPDGYVAWRSDGAAADPVGALTEAVGTALGRATDRAALAG
jgi:2-polyprenyl-6-methoxyphenol hydroxylase-like FAD-dependent oxidoreductase